MSEPRGVVDAVTVQVIRYAFIAAADEMKLAMVNTAYNDLITEVQDFGCVITDTQARLLAQSDTVPVFLSVLPGCIASGLERYGADGFAEGDVVLTNDPYTTGTHISDTAVYMPIMHEGRLVGFTGCMAHWADVGGKAPGGWCPDSTDVFQEGLRFDHVKITRDGELDERLLTLIWDNVRLPAVVRGDMEAQLAACKTGIRRVGEIYDRFGRDAVARGVEEMFDQSEALMRAALRRLPDGEFTAETLLDHDGVERERAVRLRLTLDVADGRVRADFSGSDPATRGPVNCPLPAVRSGVEGALKGLFLPDDRTNHGHYVPIEVTAPRGSVANPVFPSPVDSYGYVILAAGELCFRALADLLPDECPAGSYQLCIVHLSKVQPGDDAGSKFVYIDPAIGGAGASARGDGGDALIVFTGGDEPCPVTEIVEARYPLRVECFELDPDSGGGGRFRGGMGTVRTYVVLEDEVYAQIAVEGTRFPAAGAHGGGAARPNAVVVWPGTPRESVVQDKIGLVGPLNTGDRISIRTGGGGGWGDPSAREPQAVIDDVLDGLLTSDEARAIYGVSVDPEALGLDRAAQRR